MKFLLTRLMAEGAFMSTDLRLGGSHVSNSSHVGICFTHRGCRKSRTCWWCCASAEATIVNVRPNNRLKQTARGRSVAESRLRSRAAA